MMMQTVVPAELDNVAGRPCSPEFKNVGPTPGDSSEISIEGNFMEDCVKHPDGTGGCYAYVSSYNQFEILDISEPNNIVLLSTYCLLYTSPSPRDRSLSRMPSSA